MQANRIAAFALASLAAAVAAWAPAGGAQPAPPRPHVVYIVSDDQGWKDVGFHGSDIRTPSIDRLAQGGARLEQFYAQPMCTPSRAALMTGRYPHRYGLQTLVIPSAGTYGLATDERLLPQALKEAGYRTAIVGKWHLGHADRKYWPREREFDYQCRQAHRPHRNAAGGSNDVAGFACHWVHAMSGSLSTTKLRWRQYHPRRISPASRAALRQVNP